MNGGGADSGGSSAYPGWVGYIEYDDETGEAIAADYSGLEMGGQIPNSLMFHKINFRGDWKGSIGKFTNGNSMFSGCSNITSFSSDLSSLTIGDRMFNGCKLNTSSVERILTTIPEYSDGSSHTLSMTVQSGAAAAKFGEITGTIPTSSQKNVIFKGWTISVNTKN